ALDIGKVRKDWARPMVADITGDLLPSLLAPHVTAEIEVPRIVVDGPDHPVGGVKPVRGLPFREQIGQGRCARRERRICRKILPCFPITQLRAALHLTRIDILPDEPRGVWRKSPEGDARSRWVRVVPERAR